MYTLKEIKDIINAAKEKKRTFIIIRNIENIRTKDQQKLIKEGFEIEFISGTTLTPYTPKPFYSKISWN